MFLFIYIAYLHVFVGLNCEICRSVLKGCVWLLSFGILSCSDVENGTLGDGSVPKDDVLVPGCLMLALTFSDDFFFECEIGRVYENWIRSSWAAFG